MTARRRLLCSAVFAVFATVAAASTTWACTPTSSISSSPSSGPVATLVTITGQQFAAGRPVDIRWNATTGPLLATATGPSFSEKVAVPDAPPGTYYFVAEARNDDATLAGKSSSAFVVTGPAPSSTTTSTTTTTTAAANAPPTTSSVAASTSPTTTTPTSTEGTPTTTAPAAPANAWASGAGAGTGATASPPAAGTATGPAGVARRGASASPASVAAAPTTGAAGAGSHGDLSLPPTDATPSGAGQPADLPSQDEGGPRPQPIDATGRLAARQGPTTEHVGTTGSARAVGATLLLAVAILALRRRPLLASAWARSSSATGTTRRHGSEHANQPEHDDGDEAGR